MPWHIQRQRSASSKVLDTLARLLLWGSVTVLIVALDLVERDLIAPRQSRPFFLIARWLQRSSLNLVKLGEERS